MRPFYLTATIALGTALVASVAPSRPLKPEQEAKIAVAGKPIDCVRLQSIRETRVRDDKTIDFYMRDGKVYRNSLPYSCPQLGFEERFAYKTSLDRLCSVDIITVLPTGGGGIAGPSCGLGSFTPISGAPR